MTGAADRVFRTGLALLFVHELDAARGREWRMLPVLGRLGDEAAYRAFALAHIPLFVLFFWLLGQSGPELCLWFQTAVDAFLVAHLGQHHAFRRHAANELNGAFSRGIIQAAAAVGAAHLVVLWV